MLEILSIIVAIALAIFVGFYLAYYAICLRYSRASPSRENSHLEKSELPVVSIIIPVYNEANVLPRRIRSLEELLYPRDKLEIVFVDGGSTDGGIGLLEELAGKSSLPVKVVFQGSRKGFNSAVRDGFFQTKGDIVCITGAETEYEPRALDVMVRHFADLGIGAVTGRQMIRNVGDGYSPKLEIAYRGLYDLVRAAESRIDSPFDIKGEISAARRSIVQRLVENPELLHKGCIDACLSFQGRMDGYKTVYEPSAIYYELSPRLFRESFKQHVRRAATLIENMLVFKGMMLKRKFGAFGMLIMPAHFLMLLCLPYLFLFGSVGLLALTVLDLSNYLLLTLVVVGLLAMLLSRSVQAFIKTQIALVVAGLKLMRGVETQRFERLQSARPEGVKTIESRK